MDRGHGFEEGERILNGHIENFGDILAFVLDFQCFTVVTLALADITGNVDVGQKVHLDFGDAVALTGLTAAATYIEAEPTGFVASRPSFLRPREKLAHGGKDAGIGRGV